MDLYLCLPDHESSLFTSIPERAMYTKEGLFGGTKTLQNKPTGSPGIQRPSFLTTLFCRWKTCGPGRFISQSHTGDHTGSRIWTPIFWVQNHCCLSSSTTYSWGLSFVRDPSHSVTLCQLVYILYLFICVFAFPPMKCKLIKDRDYSLFIFFFQNERHLINQHSKVNDKEKSPPLTRVCMYIHTYISLKKYLIRGEHVAKEHV